MARRRVPPSSSGVVSATEVASYVYCPEQWRLQHGLGHSSTNTALLARGAALHRKTAAVEVWSREALRLAFVLVVLAALLVLRALFLERLSMGQGVWALALVFGCLGLLLLVLSLRARSMRGLGAGETATLDDVTLFSKRYLLTGRPDRIVKHGKFFIPEEWKSSKKVEPWHLVQLGVYFILIEDHYGVRPPTGSLCFGMGGASGSRIPRN